MAWQKVSSYSFGFSQTSKKFWLYYTLDGSASTVQVFLTPSQFSALALAFNSASAISFETTANYFATEPRTLP